MFFADFHTAFTNLARALRPGGRMVLMAGQGLAHNEGTRSFRTALAGNYRSRCRGTTGLSAFADPDWTRDLLTATGFSDIRRPGRVRSFR